MWTSCVGSLGCQPWGQRSIPSGVQSRTHTRAHTHTCASTYTYTHGTHTVHTHTYAHIPHVRADAHVHAHPHAHASIPYVLGDIVTWIYFGNPFMDFASFF